MNHKSHVSIEGLTITQKKIRIFINFILLQVRHLFNISPHKKEYINMGK